MNNSKTLIFMHGLGDQGSSWSELQYHFKNWKCIFPNAPQIPISINGGMRMPGWYDLYQLGPGREDHDGLIKSRDFIHDMIKKEITRGVSPNNIFLGGFSQGAVVALLTGLTIPLKIGGIIALSGYLPIRDVVMRQQINEIPIFMGHGIQDDVIQYSYSQLSKKALLSLNLNLTYRDYQMGHSACDEEFYDIKQWVEKHATKDSPTNEEL